MVENSPDWFEIHSPAKVNLFLDVVGKRSDGYHDIVGLFQTISLHDTLKVRFLKKDLKITSTKPIQGKNMLEKAYEIFRSKTGFEFGLEIHLIKRIPMKAGFGGGSSNAGTLLRFLGEIYKISYDDLLRIAVEVGGDVPFFLVGGTALVEGKGDVITPLNDLPQYGLDLAVPKTRMETRMAYSYLKQEDFSKAPCDVLELYNAYEEMDFSVISRCSYNVFQVILEPYIPEISETLKFLSSKKPIVELMTGSGTGCFAVFEPGKGTFHFTNFNSFSKSSNLTS